MSAIKPITLSGVAETLFITLYLRAMESQRPDALIKDEKAVALVKKINDDGLYDFIRMKSLHLSDENKLVIILRNREFDRLTQDYLNRCPYAVVVHIGCGLDSRFERLDNGQVEWFDLDLPDVIELRRKYLRGEGGRYHLISGSVLEDDWLETVTAHSQSSVLFLAEGVLMYFKEAQIKRLVLTLRDRFRGSELIFDAYSPIHVWRHNVQTASTRIDMHVNWGIWRGKIIEKWGKTNIPGEGIRLLGEWGYFDDPTPRLAHIRWARYIESLARTFRIYHFQLGNITR